MKLLRQVECIKHQTHFVDDEMTEEAKHIFPPNAETSIWDVISLQFFIRRGRD